MELCSANTVDLNEVGQVDNNEPQLLSLFNTMSCVTELEQFQMRKQSLEQEIEERFKTGIPKMLVFVVCFSMTNYFILEHNITLHLQSAKCKHKVLCRTSNQQLVLKNKFSSNPESGRHQNVCNTL